MRCGAHTCRRQAANRFPFCSSHWNMLPSDKRSALAPTEAAIKRPDRASGRALLEAVQWIAAAEGRHLADRAGDGRGSP